MKLLSIAEAATALAEKYCPTGEALRKEIEASSSQVPMVKGTMADAMKAVEGKLLRTGTGKLRRVDLSVPEQKEHSAENPQGFQSSQVKLDPKRDDGLRAGLMDTMTTLFKEQLIEAAKSGSLIVRDRITRLPCPVGSPEDENLVSMSDLNEYLVKEGLDRLDDAAHGDFIHRVHVTASKVFTEEKERTGEAPTRTRLAKFVAEELRDVPGKRGNPVTAETIRRSYLKDWKQPKV
jgi:hypothetical protein